MCSTETIDGYGEGQVRSCRADIERWRTDERLEPRAERLTVGGWHLGTSTSKYICGGVDQVKTAVGRGMKDLVIGWSRTNGDTSWDPRGGTEDMVLQLGLMVWASKPQPDGFAWFRPQNLGWSSGWTLGQHMASLWSLRRGEAKPWRARGRQMHRSKDEPFCP
jgi:hypothetical protein